MSTQQMGSFSRPWGSDETRGGDILGLFHVNSADNYLHLAIAAASLAVGFSPKKAGAGSMGPAY